MTERSTEWKLGYQQAQLDILRVCFAGNNLYLSGDMMKVARAALGFTTAPVLDRPPPLSSDSEILAKAYESISDPPKEVPF